VFPLQVEEFEFPRPVLLVEEFEFPLPELLL
jgi:hypothetical protein